jgi:hypothetical protein
MSKNVDSDFASDLLDDDSQNLSGSDTAEKDIQQLIQELESEANEFKGFNTEENQPSDSNEEAGTETKKQVPPAHTFSERYWEAEKRIKEAQAKKAMEEKLKTEQTPKQALAGTDTPPQKTLVDNIIGWATENPITAVLGLFGVGAILHSMQRNNQKQEQVVRSRRRKHKNYQSYLSDKEAGKLESVKEQDKKPERKSFVDMFAHTFKQEPEKKESPVDNTAVATAVTAAVSAGTVTHKLPTAIGAVTALALAGVGYALQSPVMMIAGAGAAAGILINVMLPKTVKQPALSKETSEEVNGLGANKESNKTTKAETGKFNEQVEQVKPEIYPTNAPDPLNSFYADPFKQFADWPDPSNTVKQNNPFASKTLVEDEIEFSDRM